MVSTPTGGISTIGGRSVLVTPSGQEVGSATGGRTFGGRASRDARPDTQAEQKKAQRQQQRQRLISEIEQIEGASISGIRNLSLGELESERTRVATQQRQLAQQVESVSGQSRPGLREASIGELQSTLREERATVQAQRDARIRAEAPSRGIERITSQFDDPILFTGEPTPLGQRIERLPEGPRGFVKAFVPQTKGEAALATGTFFLGTAVGAGSKLVGAGISKVSPSLLPKVSKGLGAAGVGFVGFEGFSRSQEFSLAETKEQRGEIIGSGVRDIGLGFGGFVTGRRAARSAIGRFRTRGLSEIPAEDVIAPEFFQGQKFPQIRRGQTAGQLRQEFFQPGLPGERAGVGRGFTARASPLPSFTPQSKPRRGELVGTFIAPKISPEFFRASGSQRRRLFSIETLESLPTAGRLQPQSIELAPGVTAGQRSVRPSQFNTIEVSRSEAGSGRALIPFVKTEKEAIIASESPIIGRESKFFFRFRGERIPIVEARVGSRTGRESVKQISVGEFSTSTGSSLRSSAASSANISPLSFVAPSISGIASRRSSQININAPKINPIVTESPKSRRPKSESPFIPSTGRGFTPSRSSSGISGDELRLFPSSSEQIISTSRRQTSKKRELSFDLPQLGVTSSRKGIRRDRKLTRRPSLVSVEFNITALKPVAFEETGLVTRPIIRERKKRKRR